MIYLQCTRPILSELALRRRDLQPAPDAISLLGNWTLNLIAVGDRRAYLFMSDRSLLSFVLLEGQKTLKMQELPHFFEHGVMQLFEFMKFPKSAAALMREDADVMVLTRTQDRSILATMNAVASDYQLRVNSAGGLGACDLTRIILAVNDMPRRRLGYATAKETSLALLLHGAA